VTGVQTCALPICLPGVSPLGLDRGPERSGDETGGHLSTEGVEDIQKSLATVLKRALIGIPAGLCGTGGNCCGDLGGGGGPLEGIGSSNDLPGSG